MPEASEEEVRRFLETTTLTRYQHVPLPHQLAIPGRDRTKVADAVFSRGVTDKRVLDVGAYYGFFALEAVKRGAGTVVAIEPDPERAAVAQRIADLYGGTYHVLRAHAEDLPLKARFELVLCLGVLHHVREPGQTLRGLAAASSELVVVEFPTLQEKKVVAHAYRRGAPVLRDVKAGLSRMALGWLTKSVPLVAVGDTPYRHGFFFSEQAFANLVTKQLGVFRHVEFEPSPRRDSRRLAFCYV